MRNLRTPIRFQLGLAWGGYYSRKRGDYQAHACCRSCDDLAKKERDTGKEELVKLQSILDPSKQKDSGLEDTVLKPPVDRDVLSRKVAVACVADEGKIAADAK